MQRVVVATDRSKTAERAVAWAAELAARYAAELVIVQVIPAANGEVDIAGAEESLQELAREIAGDRGRRGCASIPIRRRRSSTPPPTRSRRARGRECRHERPQGVPARQRPEPHLAQRALHCRDRQHDRRYADDRHPRPARGEKTRATSCSPARPRSDSIVGKYGLAERAEGHTLSTAERAKRLREALEQLGPTFSKLGQILSTRPGLLPHEFVEELAHLQDKVPPLTQAEVVAVMEQELQVPWEDVFESIDPEPLAAGTIGQVHRARLEDGDRVVVKVQRPTAREEILRDLGLLELFAEKAANRPALRELIDIPVLASNLADSLRRELDFRQEAANIERMREVLESYDRLDVPRLYSELTTRRLLVMEEIQGGPIKDRCVFLLVVADLPRYRARARWFSHLNGHLTNDMYGSADRMQFIGRLGLGRHSRSPDASLTQSALSSRSAREIQMCSAFATTQRRTAVSPSMSRWRGGKRLNLWRTRWQLLLNRRGAEVSRACVPAAGPGGRDQHCHHQALKEPLESLHDGHL